MDTRGYRNPRAIRASPGRPRESTRNRVADAGSSSTPAARDARADNDLGGHGGARTGLRLGARGRSGPQKEPPPGDSRRRCGVRGGLRCGRRATPRSGPVRRRRPPGERLTIVTEARARAPSGDGPPEVGTSDRVHRRPRPGVVPPPRGGRRAAKLVVDGDRTTRDPVRRKGSRLAGRTSRYVVAQTGLVPSTGPSRPR